MYLVIKALHLIFMVAWFAGLFYIFRLFVYHRARSQSVEIHQLLSLMERRLLYFIMLPAAFLTLAFGVTLLTQRPDLLTARWMWLKLAFVLLLFAYHSFAHHTASRFSRGDFFLSERACRMWNEFPTLLLIGIVFLAILKPS